MEMASISVIASNAACGLITTLIRKIQDRANLFHLTVETRKSTLHVQESKMRSKIENRSKEVRNGVLVYSSTGEKVFNEPSWHSCYSKFPNEKRDRNGNPRENGEANNEQD